jgi:hypothetical protein
MVLVPGGRDDYRVMSLQGERIWYPKGKIDLSERKQFFCCCLFVVGLGFELRALFYHLSNAPAQPYRLIVSVVEMGILLGLSSSPSPVKKKEYIDR